MVRYEFPRKRGQNRYVWGIDIMEDFDRFFKKEVDVEKRCKKVSLFGIAMLLWAVHLFAQGPDTLWTKTYGGADYDAGYSVQQTSDGGYIIAGATESFGAGDQDVYLVKTDANGNTLWTKTYGGAYDDIGLSVQEASDGGYIITGYTESFGAGDQDVYLIKTDINGDTLWTKTYGGESYDISYSIQQTSDGGYIIAGFTVISLSTLYDVWLMKTDANGDTLWTKTYGGISSDFGSSVQETSDSGYIVAGCTYSFGAYDVYLIKTEADGDTLWTRTYGGTYDDIGWSVQQTSDGGYIIAGITGLVRPDAIICDVYLIKTEADGDTLWTKTYGEADDDEGWSVQETSDGGYIVAGYTYSFGTHGDIWLMKTDANGDTLWTRTYGGDTTDGGSSVQQTSDGGYIIAGYTESFGAGGADVYLIKTKPDVGIKENAKCKVQNAKLDVYPNPFSQRTVISYQLPVKTAVSLEVYDISGRLVRTFTRVQCQEPRVYTVAWDGRDNAGEKLSSGVYFLRFEARPVRPLVSYGAGGYNAIRKLLIMR